MSWRVTLITIALAAGFGWLAWAPRAEAIEAQSRGIGLAPHEIASLTSGDVQLRRVAADRWTLTDDERTFDADPAEVDAVLRVLATMSVTPTRGDLANAADRVVIEKDAGERVEIEIAPRDAAGRVLGRVNGTTVELDADEASRLGRSSLRSVRSRRLIMASAASIDSVNVSTSSGEAEFTREESGWQLVDTEINDAPLNLDALRRLLTGVDRARITSFDAEVTAETEWDITVTVGDNKSAETELRFDLDDADTSGNVLASIGGEAVRVEAAWLEGLPTGAAGFVDPRPMPWRPGETSRVELLDASGIPIAAYTRTLEGWTDDLGSAVLSEAVERIESLLTALATPVPTGRANGDVADLIVLVERAGNTGSRRLKVIGPNVTAGGVAYGTSLPAWIRGN
ncbi:MAG: hypothetical protein AAGI17_02645 [Planctomycetota bacterium]